MNQSCHLTTHYFKLSTSSIHCNPADSNNKWFLSIVLSALRPQPLPWGIYFKNLPFLKIFLKLLKMLGRVPSPHCFYIVYIFHTALWECSFSLLSLFFLCTPFLDDDRLNFFFSHCGPRCLKITQKDEQNLNVFFLFFFWNWGIIDIQHYISCMCTAKLFDVCIYCEMISTIM